MTVKIDKYRLEHATHTSAIFDLTTGHKIISLSMRKGPRIKLAEHILDELNTGKYEGEMK